MPPSPRDRDAPAAEGGAVTFAPAPSAWAPLRQADFRALWLASLGSNVGTLVQGVGAAWLMTSLTSSSLAVALVQSATSLPAFLLALPAGALADVMERRKLVLIANAWMMAVAAVLGLGTVVGAMSPGILLGLTFAMGLGAAASAPAWQALVPELVPRDQLTSAVALNSAGFNMARSVGPALGGLLVAALGVASTFFLNAASFLGVIAVLARWGATERDGDLPAERVGAAMRVGASYVAHAPEVKAVLVRVGGFVTFGSAIWALLPLVARNELALGPTGYGVLLGCLGFGAVAGAALLPSARAKASADRIVLVSALAYAAASAVLAIWPHRVAVGAGLVAAGVAWLMALSCCNATVQGSAPAWVRGRALAVYLLVVYGGLALGSAVWGGVAEHLGIPGALVAAAAGLAVATLATARFQLVEPRAADVEPSGHWPEPTLYREPAPDAGPVHVVVEYQIDPAREDAFREAMREMRRMRKRDGATQWELLEDLARPGRFLELFVAPSWLEHLRQHARVTAGDRAIEALAQAFHLGEGEPPVSHLIARPVPRHRRE